MPRRKTPSVNDKKLRAKKHSMIVTGTEIYGADESKYKVEEFLGSGSFGIVYRVSSKTGESYAVKTLVAPSESLEVESFLNEGRLAVGIRHPHVIEYHYFHDGRRYESLPIYILMEYAEGGSLYQLLQTARAQQKVFSADVLIAMFQQLIAGMTAVNDVLVHRDIKPANILVKGRSLKITDFGLAKLAAEATRALTFKGGGSFPYMAPEAWRYEKNTLKLDIYALGMVFYELSTLRHPFTLNTDDPQKWMEAHMYQPVVPPHKLNPAIGTKLSQIIAKMVEKNVTERFSDWREILRLLTEAQPTSEENQPVIEQMLAKRLEQDAAAQAASAEAERKNRETEQFSKIVMFQFEQSLVSPLRDFIEDFNRQYVGKPAQFSSHTTGGSSQVKIHMPSGATISLDFYTLLETAFTRDVRKVDFFGHPFTRTELQMPQINNRRIKGWGVLEGSDKRGINILLLDQPGELYGEWMMLINTAGMFSDVWNRPEPFAFDFSELEKAVHLIGVLGKYQVHAKPLDIAYLKEFIGSYA